MARPSCSLWMFVARTDVSFMMHTIPHLVRMNHFPFEEKVLVIDTAPLTGDKVGRPGIGTMQELKECTQQLLKAILSIGLSILIIILIIVGKFTASTLVPRFAAPTTIKGIQY